MKQIIGLVLMMVLGLAFDHRALKAESQTDLEIDYIGLAGRLVREGDYQSAAENLAKVAEEQRSSEGYQLVEALLDLYQDRYADALAGFKKIIASASKDRYLWIYQAQANFGLKDYQAVLTSLAEVQDLVSAIPTVAAMRLRSLWQLEDHAKAWRELQIQIHSQGMTANLAKLQLEWTMEKKLYQAGLEFTLGEISANRLSFEAKLDLVAILRNADQSRAALQCLEILRLTSKDSAAATARLAYLYAEAQDYHSAARLFHEAALIDPSLMFQAAEVYLKAGQPMTALRLNRQVQDQVKKFRQRLAILIATGDYEGAAGSESDLKRLGLLASEELRYALAFAFYKTRQFDRLDYHLNLIQSPELFAKAVALRKEMIQCQTAGDCA